MLANHGSCSIWVGYTEGHSTGTYRIFNPKTNKIILTRDVTFLQKSYSEYTKVDKPVVVTTSYEGSTKEEKLKIVPVVINNNNLNVVTDLETESSKNDFENDDKNVFDEDVDDQVKANPQTTINTIVVQAMKKLQAFYNNDQQNCQGSNTREKCLLKFKFSHQSCYGDQ